MTSCHDSGTPITRRRAVRGLSLAGLGAGLCGNRLLAAEGKQVDRKAPMLVGVDAWSLSFACGVRREFKPARRIGAADILEKVRRWGLKGAQVEVPQMPKLGSPEFRTLQRKIADAGLYWEVSAGMVQNEAGVRLAMEYNLALGSKVVRAFMEGFGIQFKPISLDDYVSEAIAHIRNLLPEFENRGLYLCLENHGGLRMKHLRRVLKTFPNEHLGINLDTGNAVLTLEDPVEVANELAPRTYTCHLKDWNLIRCPEGLIARGCASGEGVVDLKAIVEILRAKAPQDRPLHLSIESPQEHLVLKMLTAEFWRGHGDVTGRELGNMLRLAEKRNMPIQGEYRIAALRGEGESTILAEEEAAIARSVAYCRDVLHLL